MTTKERKKLDKYYSKYGLTYSEYCDLFARQGLCCALCERPKKLGQRRFPVDHSHKSGRTRAIVCFYCNKYRIGRFDLYWAKKLLDYMVRYDG